MGLARPMEIAASLPLLAMTSNIDLRSEGHGVPPAKNFASFAPLRLCVFALNHLPFNDRFQAVA